MSAHGWHSWAYVVACIAIPATWGAVSVWLFDKLNRRSARPDRARPPTDYSI